MRGTTSRVWVGLWIWGLSSLACDAAVDNPSTDRLGPTRTERFEREHAPSMSAKADSPDAGIPRNPKSLCASGMNIILGTPRDDVLVGTTGDDCILGLAGNDVIRGGDGNDVLVGGAGNDFLHGGAGNDRAYGLSGHDTLKGEGDNDSLDGGPGNDHLTGGDGNDVLVGGRGDDRLVGGDGEDVLEGGGGNDVLVGASAIDLIRGSAGNDLHMGPAQSPAAATENRTKATRNSCASGDCEQRRYTRGTRSNRYVRRYDSERPRRSRRSRFRAGGSTYHNDHTGDDY